jgi:hypothetical protein
MLRILFLISCSCVLAQGKINEDEKMDVFRLPNNTQPTSYRLQITPIIDPLNNNFEFTGEVVINILVKYSTPVLTLNAVELNIQTIEIKNINNMAESITNEFKLVEKNEQLKITIEEPGFIADQQYEVKIKYSGELRNDMIGFYRSSYKNEKSETK